MSKLSSTDENIVRGQRLIAIRESKRLTQVEFAEKLGLSARAYQNYERGEREMPVALYQSLYDVFKIDPLWLLAGLDTTPTYADNRRVDIELVENIIRLVEQHLANRRAKLAPQKKARLIRLIYEHCMDDGSVEDGYIKEMVLLTA